MISLKRNNNGQLVRAAGLRTRTSLEFPISTKNEIELIFMQFYPNNDQSQVQFIY